MRYKVERPMPPSAVFPTLEIIEAKSVVIDAGTLSFWDGPTDLVAAYSINEWAKVEAAQTLTPEKPDLFTAATQATVGG